MSRLPPLDRSSPSYTPRAVAHVLASLATGGAERVAVTLALAQRRRGDRVTVVELEGPREGGLAERLAEGGVPVVHVPRRPGRDPTLPLRVGAVLRERRPDVVHTHNALPLVHAAPVASWLGARTIHTKHGPHRAHGASLVVRRAAGRFVDSFVAVSSETAETVIRQREARPGTLVVIDNGIDLAASAADPARRRTLRAEWGIGNDVVLVGTVARLEPVKNHLGLLRALAPLLGPRVRWVVVGDGAERRELAVVAEALGVSRWLLRLGERHDAASLYTALDVFAMASHAEGLPLAVLEAMSCGLPVIATAVGGLLESLPDVAALVPPNDERALREALARLLEDGGERGRLGALGLARVHARHSEGAMLGAYDRVYATPPGARDMDPS